MNLALLAASLGLLLGCSLFVATHPTGDLLRCASALQAARLGAATP